MGNPVMGCSRCDGCGMLADSKDGEPWSSWMNLPLKSSAAVVFGVVKPIPCPDCGVHAGDFVKVNDDRTSFNRRVLEVFVEGGRRRLRLEFSPGARFPPGNGGYVVDEEECTVTRTREERVADRLMEEP
jgi:hypothetical protein